MDTIYKNEAIDINRDVRLFLDKIAELNDYKSATHGLQVICTLPISPALKFKTCIFTPFTQILKTLLK